MLSMVQKMAIWWWRHAALVVIAMIAVTVLAVAQLGPNHLAVSGCLVLLMGLTWVLLLRTWRYRRRDRLYYRRLRREIEESAPVRAETIKAIKGFRHRYSNRHRVVILLVYLAVMLLSLPLLAQNLGVMGSTLSLLVGLSLAAVVLMFFFCLGTPPVDLSGLLVLIGGGVLQQLGGRRDENEFGDDRFDKHSRSDDDDEEGGEVKPFSRRGLPLPWE